MLILVFGPSAEKDASKLAGGGQPAGWTFRVATDPLPLEPKPDGLLIPREWMAQADRSQDLASRWPMPHRPGIIGLPTDWSDTTLESFLSELPEALEAAWIRNSLRQFRDLGGPEFVTEMIALFHSQSAAQIAQLDEAHAKGDFATARRMAHTLKSTFANYGSRSLQALAFSMEKDASNSVTNHFAQNIATLKTGHARFGDLLNKLAG
jgi:HPt (histidine-containing phosphotransfer) domain-containing protein